MMYDAFPFGSAGLIPYRLQTSISLEKPPFVDRGV